MASGPGPRSRWLAKTATRHPIALLVMAVYRTTFPIVASAETVWMLLTDFERDSEWNPSLPSISGEVRAGSIVSLTLGMPCTPSATVKAKLGDVAPERRLTWHGNAGADLDEAGSVHDSEAEALTAATGP
jgi:uncharacterized membrane protein